MEGVISPCVPSAKKDSLSIVRVKRHGVSGWEGVNMAGKRVSSLFLHLFVCMSIFSCVYICALLACMYGHHLPAQCPWRSEEALDPLDLELWIVVNCGSWEPNLLEEQKMLLITEASFHPWGRGGMLIWDLRSRGFSKDGRVDGEEIWRRTLSEVPWRRWEAKESKGKVRHVDLRAGV